MLALVTGFEKFGPYPVNPTQDLMIQLDGKMFGDVVIHAVTLPAIYGVSSCLLDLVDELDPEMVISFGLASRIPRLRLETYGRNWMESNYADNRGVIATGEKIDPDGPNFCRTNIDAIGLAHALHQASVPVDISVDAEAFVCNALIYQIILCLCHSSQKVLFTYFHTPWPDRYLDRITLEPGKVTIPWETLERTVRITAVFLRDEISRAQAGRR